MDSKVPSDGPTVRIPWPARECTHSTAQATGKLMTYDTHVNSTCNFWTQPTHKFILKPRNFTPTKTMNSDTQSSRPAPSKCIPLSQHCNTNINLRDVLTAVPLTIQVFWDETLYHWTKCFWRLRSKAEPSRVKLQNLRNDSPKGTESHPRWRESWKLFPSSTSFMSTYHFWRGLRPWCQTPDPPVVGMILLHMPWDSERRGAGHRPCC